MARPSSARPCHATQVPTALDIPAAFKGAEKPFLEASDKLQGAVGSAVTAAPTSCAALATALQPVDDACDSCHKRFR